MHDYATLNPLAAGEIDDLRADGIEPTPAEIVKLSYIGWQTQRPHSRLEQSRGAPIPAGNVTLWPMTMHACDWYRTTGCRIGLDNYALAYAMAHCYEGADALDCRQRLRCKLRVTAWAATLRCTMQQLQEAMSQVIAQGEDLEMPPEPQSSPRVSLGDISARLATMTGIAPDFWERRCSREYAIAALTTSMAQANESGKPLPTDPVVKGTRALGWAAEKIRRRHERAQCQNAE